MTVGELERILRYANFDDEISVLVTMIRGGRGFVAKVGIDCACRDLTTRNSFVISTDIIEEIRVTFTNADTNIGVAHGQDTEV